MKKLLLLPLFLLAFAPVQGEEGDTTTQTAPAAGDAASSHDEEFTKLKGTVESLNESFLETKGVVDKLAKIKLSGYIQPQWQYADSMGVANVAGGPFPANSRERFMVRRGRLKTTYETPTSRYVLQIDVVPAGVTLKDAYLTLMEPWLKTVSYTMGIFDRPFGFEISYSSSSRESPERSRVFQTLFPGERDLGAKLEITPPAELGLLQYFNLKGGLFTGLGPTTNEIDNNKDFIGRAGFQVPLYDLNLALDGGFSAYIGESTNLNDTAYKVGTVAGVKRFVIDSLSRTVMSQRMQDFDRKVMGVDAQLYYDIPVLGGMSLRGEYLWGEIPSLRNSSGLYATATGPLAQREIMGWYGMWVQNLGTLFQTVVKYDVYDPNTEVEGKDIGLAASNLNASDLMYSTLGLGLIYHWDENLKFTFYYDMVTNEEVSSATTTAALVPFKKDIPDNIFTFRGQMKF